MVVDKEKLCESLLEALKQELQAEMEQTTDALKSMPPKVLARRGLAVLNLSLASVSIGLGGRTILTLNLHNAIMKNGQLDLGSIHMGDNVGIQVQGAATISANVPERVEGVVYRTTPTSVAIVVDEKFEDKCEDLDGPRLFMVCLANPATYRRMEYAVKDLLSDALNSSLHRIVLGDLDPQPIAEPDISTLSLSDTTPSDISFLDSTLNGSQKDAVRFALENQVSVIHGPPGTGKTYTVVEIVRQLVNKGERVLVCGPSNISVDNVLERLHPYMKNGNQLIRVGHPARLLPSNLVHSLEVVASSSDRGAIVKDIQSEIELKLRSAKKARNGRERRDIYADIGKLRKEYKQREKAIIRDLIVGARVVVATLHGAGSQSIKSAEAYYRDEKGGKSLFDTIIIDEVSQSLEPQCWIPLMMFPNAKRLVLAGDNKQLPPTIKCDTPKCRETLEYTLFDRLVDGHGDRIKRLLSVQYRMNSEIMEFPSQAMYSSKLKAAECVANCRLYDLPGVSKSDESQSCVVWLDTQGGDFPETMQSQDPNSKSIFGSSKFNDGEARLVLQYITRLLNLGVEEHNIGVISPYSSQIRHIKELVLPKHPKVEISTIDGFQGREMEVIVISLVRSNEKNEVGFLKEDRRLNVAMTRPKKQLCIIGDMETIGSGSPFLEKWVQWAESNADIEYPDFAQVYS